MGVALLRRYVVYCYIMAFLSLFLQYFFPLYYSQIIDVDILEASHIFELL